MLRTPTTLLQRSCAAPSMISMLGLHPRRSISTIGQRVYSDTVFMSETYPARLTIPSQTGANYEFTCENQVKVGEFQEQVNSNVEGDLDFQLLQADGKTPIDEKALVGDVKACKFSMRVNGKVYAVYPDLRSIVQKKPPSKNVKENAKARHMDQSITISRQLILRDYFESLVTAMKKEQATGGKLSAEKLQKAMEQSIKMYSQAVEAERSRVQQTLNELRSDLEIQQKDRDAVLDQTERTANLWLRVGLAGSMAQLVGFTLGIYVIYDWGEMEPYTWMFQAFYMMVGSFYYLLHRSDWVYTSVYDAAVNAAKDKQLKQRQPDLLDRVQAMEDYFNNLEEQIEINFGCDDGQGSLSEEAAK